MGRIWLVVVVLAIVAGSFYIYRQRRAAAPDGIPTSEPLRYAGVLFSETTPVDGDTTITLKIWDAAKGGTTVCFVGPSLVPVTQGRFSMLLPDACTAAVRADPDLWIEVIVGVESLGRSSWGRSRTRSRLDAPRRHRARSRRPSRRSRPMSPGRPWSTRRPARPGPSRRRECATPRRPPAP